MAILFLFSFSIIAKVKERKRKKNYALFIRYSKLKKRVLAIFDGDDTTTDVRKFAKEIRKCYVEKEISATHYEDLMKYLGAHYFLSHYDANRNDIRL